MAAHIGLAILMMSLVLGFFSPKTTPFVELLVLFLFLGDEVPLRNPAIQKLSFQSTSF